MKTNKFIAALLMGAAIVACSPKAENATEGEEAVVPAKTAKDYEASKSMKDSVAYLVGIQFGAFIRNYDFGDLNYAQIKKGMTDFINAKGNMRDPEFGEQFKINPEEMNDLFNTYLEMRRNQKLLTNKEEGEKFLAANKKKEGVEETPSGLQYRIYDQGSDLKATSDKDTVFVRYKGTLLDGTVFDEVKADADSVSFVLGQVVRGWQEGMKLVGEGGRILLYVPSELAYGERAPQEIGPNQTLIFDVELCKVLPFVEPVKEETK